MKRWIAKARTVRLSSLVAALFTAAMIFPWLGFLWLTTDERTEHLKRAERNLEAFAAAYAEHASAIARFEDGDAQLEEFRAALRAPDVHFALKTIPRADNAQGSTETPSPTLSFDDRNRILTAEADRPALGFAATASIPESAALGDWRHHASMEAVGLLIRTFVGIAVGIFLVGQLRWREQVQAKLARARAAAESSNRAKSEFLANMSHELRTPLNAIIGFADVIQRGMFGPLPERYRDYGGDILASGTHLLHVINEILDLSKLEAGQLELHEEETDIPLLIRASVRLVEPQAAKGKIVLSEIVSPGLPALRGDERRLRQVLINLLSNAVKFTPEDGRVDIRAARTASGIAIEVRDTGIGMSEDEIAIALEPFGQIESSTSRKHEGTGLGLPLAKRLIELHGGTLKVRSEREVGTTITISLPAERILLPNQRQSLAQAG